MRAWRERMSCCRRRDGSDKLGFRVGVYLVVNGHMTSSRVKSYSRPLLAPIFATPLNQVLDIYPLEAKTELTPLTRLLVAPVIQNSCQTSTRARQLGSASPLWMVSPGPSAAS